MGAEREQLANAIAARPLVFSAWAFATGGEQLPAIAEKLPGLRLKAGAIADRALAALDGRR